MNTEQKYVCAESNPTPIEPKATQAKRAGDLLLLHCPPGESAALLYGALAAERDRLQQRAPWLLVENDIEYFQQTMKDLDEINDQLANLFDSLNERMIELREQSTSSRISIAEDLEEREERIAIIEKLLKLRTEQLGELEKQTNPIATN